VIDHPLVGTQKKSRTYSRRSRLCRRGDLHIIGFEHSVQLRGTVRARLRICPRSTVRLSAICLRKIDLLPRAKNGTLAGLYIGRYRPQAQRHIDRVDAERGPEGELANTMLFRMAAAHRGTA